MSKLPILSGVPRSVMPWIVVFVWMIAISIFSTDFFSDAHTTALLFTPSIGTAIRKLAHWGEYFVLAVLLIRALNSRSIEVIPTGRMLMVVIFAAFYAAVDEWHQSFVPSRNGTTHDVLIDAIGAVCGASIVYAYAAINSLPPRLKRASEQLQISPRPRKRHSAWGEKAPSQS
jgi:VanZ family protein